jgi:hypothetical protein
MRIRSDTVAALRCDALRDRAASSRYSAIAAEFP